MRKIGKRGTAFVQKESDDSYKKTSCDKCPIDWGIPPVNPLVETSLQNCEQREISGVNRMSILWGAGYLLASNWHSFWRIWCPVSMEPEEPWHPQVTSNSHFCQMVWCLCVGRCSENETLTVFWGLSDCRAPQESYPLDSFLASTCMNQTEI